MPEKVFVSNIQRFSTKDGPGIRTTVFFKGCPLHCKWCHNPETLSQYPEIMYSGENCRLCGRCVYSCPSGALSVSKERIVTDRTKCTVCGKCADVCYYSAREVSGRELSVSELCASLERDIPFYSESGGGVTLSGGECMIYAGFISEILRFCKANHINTAVDTSGFVPFSEFEKVLPYTDIFLYDIKAYSSDLHKELTGVPNELIWDNLFRLAERGAEIFLRLPLIEGCNADFDEVEKIAEKVSSLKIAQINLLPYHDMGKYKYTKLSLEYDEEAMSTPSPEKMEHIKKVFEDRGFTNIKIGG